MKIIVEDITEEVKSRVFKHKSNKKNVEIPVSTLWEPRQKEFSEVDNIPPDKWDFQIKKVKY